MIPVAVLGMALESYLGHVLSNPVPLTLWVIVEPLIND